MIVDICFHTTTIFSPAILVRHEADGEGPDEHAQHVCGADNVPVVKYCIGLHEFLSK